MTSSFREAVKTEQKRIQRLIDLSAREEPHSPRGSLHLEKRGNKTYCYEHRYQKGNRVYRKYIGKTDSEAAQRLAAEAYRAEQLRRLRADQKILLSLDDAYLDYGRAEVTASLSNACQKVLRGSSFNQRYEEVRAWANADYERNSAPFFDSENYAVDGTRTRSKGETIFYNIFYDMGVLFRFDSVIRYTDERGVVQELAPDFLILCLDGTMIAIEHLGWVKGLSYGLRFGEKCYSYLQNGFILSKNYFVTSDDKFGGTDSAAIHQVAYQVQRMFFGY